MIVMKIKKEKAQKVCNKTKTLIYRSQKLSRGKST